MAGLGRRTFAPGEVLTASNVMNYLQDQVVQNYAGTAARGSAIGSAVSQGMVSYLDDSNSLEVYKTVGTAVAGWEPVNLAQSPNVVINGGFDIWQRGTSGAAFGATAGFVADRWQGARVSAATGQTMSRQASGLTGFQYAMRIQRDSGNTGTQALRISQSIESSNCYEFAGKPVTVSFYVRTGGNYSGGAVTVNVFSGTGTDQNNLISGFTGNATVINSTHTPSSSWTRFSASGVVGSSATQLAVMFSYTPSGTAGANDWLEITGVQVEAGQTATPFRRNANSLQGELAACQRYFVSLGDNPGNAFGIFGTGGISFSTTQALIAFPLPVPMRTTPTTSVSNGTHFNVDIVNIVSLATTSMAGGANTTSNAINFVATHNSNGNAGGFKTISMVANNTTAARIYASAEL